MRGFKTGFQVTEIVISTNQHGLRSFIAKAYMDTLMKKQ